MYLSRQSCFASSIQARIYPGTPHLVSSIQACIYPGSHAMPHLSRLVSIQAVMPCLIYSGTYLSRQAPLTLSHPSRLVYIQAVLHCLIHPDMYLSRQSCLASSMQACIYPGSHAFPHSSRLVSIQAGTPHLASYILACIYPGSLALPHPSRHVSIQAVMPCLIHRGMYLSRQSCFSSSIKTCSYPGGHALPCLASPNPAYIYPGSHPLSCLIHPGTPCLIRPGSHPLPCLALFIQAVTPCLALSIQAPLVLFIQAVTPCLTSPIQAPLALFIQAVTPCLALLQPSRHPCLIHPGTHPSHYLTYSTSFKRLRDHP